MTKMAGVTQANPWFYRKRGFHNPDIRDENITELILKDVGKVILVGSFDINSLEALSLLRTKQMQLPKICRLE